METTNVRKINNAVYQQAIRGRRQVKTSEGLRVIKARTVKGQLQVKLLGSGAWISVESVTIE